MSIPEGMRVRIWDQSPIRSKPHLSLPFMDCGAPRGWVSILGRPIVVGEIVTAKMVVRKKSNSLSAGSRPLFARANTDAANHPDMLVPLKVEPDASADQLLANVMIPVYAGIHSDIVEVMVLNKRAPLARPIIIRPRDGIESEGTAVGPATGGESASAVIKGNIAARRFRIVGSHASPDIGLEPTKRESGDKVRHKRSGINQIAAVRDLAAIQLEVDVGRNAVIEHVFFNRRPECSFTENVSDLYSTVPANVVIDIQRNDVPIWKST